MYQIKRSYSDEISITAEYSENIDKDAYVLIFNVTENVGIPTEIFLYRKNTDLTDSFICVCQPYMLSDENIYPKTRPGEGGYGFYRKKSVELSYTSASEVLTNRTDVINKITQLVEDYGTVISKFKTTPTEQKIEYEEEEE